MGHVLMKTDVKRVTMRDTIRETRGRKTCVPVVGAKEQTSGVRHRVVRLCRRFANKAFRPSRSLPIKRSAATNTSVVGPSTILLLHYSQIYLVI